MKKIITTVIFLMLITSIFAQVEFTLNGIKYSETLSSTSAKTVAVASGGTYTGSINIPTSVVYLGISYNVTSIANNAFYNCSSLTAITIPNSVTSIGNYAFGICGGLTSIIIPSSVISIGNYAFYNCSNITNITIPSSVTSIGECAFIYCMKLTEISVQSGSINFSSLNGVLFNKNQSSLLCYPGGISGAYVIPNSVKMIGNYAFSNCHTGLTGITIPNTVTSIGVSAFWNCNGLNSIIIPNSVSSIGDNAFAACYGLTNITVQDGNINYVSSDGILFNKSQSTITLFPIKKNTSNYTIPNTVTSIASYAFYGCSILSDITIPGTVANIGSQAFGNCSALKKISYNRISVPNIDAYVFYNVNKTTCVLEVPTQSVNAYKTSNYWKDFTLIVGIGTNYDTKSINLTTVGSLSTLLTTADKTLVTNLTVSGKINAQDIKCMRDEMTKLSILDLSNATIQSYTGMGGTASATISTNYPANDLPEKSFNYKASLTSIKLPNSLISIGKYALYLCYNLTKVDISKPLISIGEYAFKSCTKLTSLTLPNSVTTIGNSAFSSCSMLLNLTISNSVTTIGDGAFSSCSKLTSLALPNTVINIGNSAFSSCSALESISLGNSVTTIGDYAFRSCSKLTGLNLPNTVTSIGNSAFYNCSELLNLTIGNSVTTIGNNAFSRCSKLSSLDLSNNTVTSIGSYAFSSSGITKIYIPESVVKIGNNAFSNCSILSDIGVNENNLRYSSLDGVLFNKVQDTLIICPPNKVGQYNIPSTVKSIETSAFFGCKYLTGISIPPLVREITSDNFNECSGLSCISVDAENNFYSSADKILYNKLQDTLIFCSRALQGDCSLPETVRTIGKQAFNACSKISGVVLSPKLQTIESAAFNSCINLTNIEIPDSVTTIGTHAFYGCSGLNSLVLGKKISIINAWGFYNCKGLKSIYVKNSTPPTCLEDGKNVDAFDGVDRLNCIIYVPIGSKELFKNANVWKDFTNIIEMSITDAPQINKLNFSISSNPTNGNITINGLENLANVKIYNTNGQVLITRQVMPNEAVSVNSLSQGVYIVKVNNSDGIYQTKFIKK